jgi:predicted nucleic acid-binding protein
MRPNGQPERLCTTVPVFVDSSVLVYCRDLSEPEKQEQAQAWMAHLWRTRGGRLSTQVLYEFYVTVTDKLRPGLPREEAHADVTALLAWRPAPMDGALTTQAMDIEDAYGLSFWEALILASAKRSGCDLLLTEALQDGQALGGTTVLNPFSHNPGGAG